MAGLDRWRRSGGRGLMLMSTFLLYSVFGLLIWRIKESERCRHPWLARLLIPWEHIEGHLSLPRPTNRTKCHRRYITVSESEHSLGVFQINCGCCCLLKNTAIFCFVCLANMRREGDKKTGITGSTTEQYAGQVSYDLSHSLLSLLFSVASCQTGLRDRASGDWWGWVVGKRGP